MTLLSNACAIHHRFNRLASTLESPVLLAIRLWMAEIFLTSGWGKLQNYLNGDGASTIYLFEEIHPVPFLPAEIAAASATAGELALGTLLLVGLLGRFAGLGLLVMTIVIELSLPQIQTHALWMMLFAVIVVRGSGAFSLDGLMKRLWCKPAA